MSEPGAASSVDSHHHAVVWNLVKLRGAAVDLGVVLQPLLLQHPEAKGVFEELTGSVARALSLVNYSQEARVAADTRPKAATAGGKRRVSRRRSSQPYSWTKIVSKNLDDGHTWRKYGQKDIQSAKHPRSYFRCTHKHDQGCKAIRQVQVSEMDASSYIITYFGEHTCQDSSLAPQIKSEGPHLISFRTGGSQKIGRQETPAAQGFPVPAFLTQRWDEEMLCNEASVSISPARTAATYQSAPVAARSVAPPANDYGDVTSSCLQTCDGSLMEMEFMADMLEFERLLGFDPDCFLAGY